MKPTDKRYQAYLDILLDLGLVGLVMAMIHILMSFRRGFILAHSTSTPEALWALAYLTFVSIASLAAVTLITVASGIFWTYYVALTLSLCQRTRQQSLGQHIRSRSIVQSGQTT